jgi:hypothetical protein
MVGSVGALLSDVLATQSIVKSQQDGPGMLLQ